MMKYIVIKPQAGLCNRMRAIAGTIELSRVLNRRLVILWARDSVLNCKFEDIFAYFPYKVIELEENGLLQRTISFVIKRIFRFKVLDDKWIVAADRLKNVSNYEKFLSNHNLFIDACEEIMRGSGDYTNFHLNSRLSEIVKEKNLSDNIIGLHIRRTDNIESRKNSPTELFEDAINKEMNLNPDVRFFLATDDIKEEDYFTSRYGDRIIVHKKESLDRNNPQAIYDAAIDLFCLSHCKKIYGSFYSSFSDVAALLGKTEIEILKA